MKQYLYALSSLLMLSLFCACSNSEEKSFFNEETNVEKPSYVSEQDNVEPSLYNTWVLVSYGNESKEVKKESEGYIYTITFNPEGTYYGWAYGNQIGGDYKCIDDKIEITYFLITKVEDEKADPDEFFLRNIKHFNNKYSLINKELRLYYSEDEYFKFRIKK